MEIEPKYMEKGTNLVNVVRRRGTNNDCIIVLPLEDRVVREPSQRDLSESELVLLRNLSNHETKIVSTRGKDEAISGPMR